MIYVLMVVSFLGYAGSNVTEHRFATRADCERVAAWLVEAGKLSKPILAQCFAVESTP